MTKVLPGIRERFVLITHNSDANIDESYADLAGDPRIIRWFAQNLLFRHPKLIALPIGLENRWYHNNGIVRDFDRLRSRRIPKRMRILYAFNVWTNPGERKPALESMKSTGLADGPQWTTSARYRKGLAEYCFTLSPPGNGFDCHRTWEALYLGTVPIVKRSPFFEAFPELPAMIVDDWREVTAWDEDFLRLSYDRLQPKIAVVPLPLDGSLDRGDQEVAKDFELLILTIERDVGKLAFGMPLLRRYLAPRRTVFVAPKACIARLERERIPQEGDLTLVEDEILEGLTLFSSATSCTPAVRNHGAEPRRGPAGTSSSWSYSRTPRCRQPPTAISYGTRTPCRSTKCPSSTKAGKSYSM